MDNRVVHRRIVYFADAITNVVMALSLDVNNLHHEHDIMMNLQ